MKKKKGGGGWGGKESNGLRERRGEGGPGSMRNQKTCTKDGRAIIHSHNSFPYTLLLLF